MDPLETDDLSKTQPVTLALMRDTLGMHLGSLEKEKLRGGEEKKRSGHRAEKTHIDKETERQLRALGYMGD